MGQPGFFDLSRRYEGLDAKQDPLVAILAAVPFELFRPQLKAALVAGGLRTAEGARKSAAGRKPWDEVLIFKVLVLQALYNLSDDQAEYQLRDRLSFLPRASAILAMTMRRSRRVRPRRNGKRSPPRTARKTRMRGGPKSTARRIMATRTPSMSIAATSWVAPPCGDLGLGA